MGRFVADPNPVRPCAGPCGRMTRPGKMALSGAPGTITRASTTMCSACHAALTATAPDPAAEEAKAAREAQRQAERIAAAHKVAETIARQRQERQAAAGRKHLARQIAVQRGLISA